MPQIEGIPRTKKTSRDLTPHTNLITNSGDSTLMSQSTPHWKTLPLGSKVSTNLSYKIDITMYSTPQNFLLGKNYNTWLHISPSSRMGGPESCNRKGTKVSTHMGLEKGNTKNSNRNHHVKKRRLSLRKITNMMWPTIIINHSCVQILKRRSHVGQTTESPPQMGWTQQITP